MTSIKKGDALGDCPECDGKQAVIYRGNNEGVCKSCGLVCEIELEEGEQEVEETQPETPVEVAPEPTPEPTPPPAPAAQPEPVTPAPHVPKPIEPVLPQAGATEAPTSFATPPVAKTVEPAIGETTAEHAPPKVVVDGAGSLQEVMGTPIKVKDKLKLQMPERKQAAAELNIPAYVQKTRPWRWAQEMGETGNPYRSTTKSHEIYLMISHGPTDMKGLIKNLYEQKPDVCSRMNILLTIYEVVTQCIAAGLLVMDEQTGIMQVCEGPPQPHKMP